MNTFSPAGLVCAYMLVAMATFADQPGIDLTVYNSDLGVVRERREMELPVGQGTVVYTDVAARIDPTTVHFKSLSKPGDCQVLEQNFDYDLIDANALLRKYIDHSVRVHTADGREISGTLASYDDARLVLTGVSPTEPAVIIERSDNVRKIIGGELPGGLVTRPTLNWLIRCESGGRQLTELSYMTGGIRWSADYVLVYDGASKADLTGWVTLDNRSGKTYRDARLKLIAGEIHRAAPPQFPGEMRVFAMAKEAGNGYGFEEKSFFEYHLYTLSRPTTVADNQIKQVELLRGEGATVDKLLYYDGAKGFRFEGGRSNDPGYVPTGNTKVDVVLRFKNSQQNGLGIPLPKGKLRVYQRDSDGALELIGEDSIDHTPKDEEVRVRMGESFDIVGERTQTAFEQPTPRTMRESFRIVLRNRKDEQARVTVVERMYRWSEWKIEQASMEYKQRDAQSVEFDVVLPAGGEHEITYTVAYRW